MVIGNRLKELRESKELNFDPIRCGLDVHPTARRKSQAKLRDILRTAKKRMALMKPHCQVVTAK
jgi:hypothetical protein